MYIKDLVEFGLSEKEAKTYLALLELEIAGVQEIATSAGVNRSSAYVTLEALKKRGLVSVSDDKKVRRYVATPPEAILRVAEDMAHKQENIRRKIESIVPEMKAMFKGTKKKPLVKVFEGKEGILATLEGTLGSREKFIRVFSSIDEYFVRTIPEYFPEKYIRARLQSGVRMRGIHLAGPQVIEGLNRLNGIVKGFDEHVMLPINKHKNNSAANLAVYDSKILYISPEEKGTTIVIDSHEIATAMKEVFDFAWEEAKRKMLSSQKKKTKA